MLATFIITMLILIVVIGIPFVLLCAIIEAIYRGGIVYVKQIGTSGNKVLLQVHYKRGTDYITTVKFGSSEHKAYMKYIKQ